MPSIWSVRKAPVRQATASPYYFMKSDIKNCYWSCRLPPEWLDTFVVQHSGRRYRYLVLPFGFDAAVFALNRKAGDLVQEVLAKAPPNLAAALEVLQYVDDILVYGRDRVAV